MTALSEVGSTQLRRQSPAMSARLWTYFRQRSARFYVGVLLVALIAGAIVFADLLPFSDPYFPYRGFELKGPSWQFPLGTDEIGRDLLARIVYGGRPTLASAFIGVLVAALIGVPLGLISGLIGGVFDNATGRLADATFALPTILVGVGLAAALGGGPLSVTIAIIVGSWPAFVRVARAGALQEKALPYVEALRSLGASHGRIVFRHILPNALGPILVQFTVAMAIAVLVESGLSFLGMGTQPPSPSWGGLLSDSRRFLRTAAYYAVFPGLAISMLVIGVNFIADELSGEALISSRVNRARRGALAHSSTANALLEVSNLKASFGGVHGRIPVLNGVELTLPKGEILGIVGESGSGKSVTMFTVTGLNRRQDIAVDSGTAWLLGDELLGMPEAALRGRRGMSIGMVFQNPAAALNPIKPIGWQITEALAAHGSHDRHGGLAARTIDLLRQVQLPDPETIGRRYPHELSGGQRQRVVIAMAVANAPALLIADEPTTALDVTVQAQVLDLLKRLSQRPDSSLAIITHDLGVVAEVADHVAVMYYGRVVETGPVDRIFAAPAHPYTRGLLASIPRLDHRVTRFRAIAGAPPRPGEIRQGCAFVDRCDLSHGRAECRSVAPPLRVLSDGSSSACHFAEELVGLPPQDHAGHDIAFVPAEAATDTTPLLVARGVAVTYRQRDGRELKAVRGVDLDVNRGTALGIVGESGCGKSSLLRALMNLPAPTAGRVAFDGANYGGMGRNALRQLRRNMQIVQQDPSTALDRRMRVIGIVREALDIYSIGSPAERDRRARDYLERVGIGDDLVHRRPSELSGGQQQRVAIARALVLHPRMLLLDEAFSALDVSVRAQVLNLLADLRQEFGLTYVFVSHDVSVIRSVADKIAIMYLGRVVELGSNAEVFGHPSHPYTQALLSAVPVPDPAAARGKRRIILKGEPPDPADPPSGCAFRTRCWKAQPACARAIPELIRPTSRGGEVACFFPD